jgi:hypothetical protein
MDVIHMKIFEPKEWRARVREGGGAGCGLKCKSKMLRWLRRDSIKPGHNKKLLPAYAVAPDFGSLSPMCTKLPLLLRTV